MIPFRKNRVCEGGREVIVCIRGMVAVVFLCSGGTEKWRLRYLVTLMYVASGNSFLGPANLVFKIYPRAIQIKDQDLTLGILLLLCCSTGLIGALLDRYSDMTFQLSLNGEDFPNPTAMASRDTCNSVPDISPCSNFDCDLSVSLPVLSRL